MTSVTVPEWPLGAPLRARRNSLHLSQKRAARIAAISSSKWRQLEDGYTVIRGVRQPVGTTAETVARAARAVQWDVADALRVAGYDVADHVDLIAEMSEPQEGADVVPGFSLLSRPTQRALLDLVDSLNGVTGGSRSEQVGIGRGPLPSDALQRGRPVAYSDESTRTQTGES